MTEAVLLESLLRATLLLGAVVVAAGLSMRAPAACHAAVLSGFVALLAIPLFALFAPSSWFAVPSLTSALAATSEAAGPGGATVALPRSVAGPTIPLVPVLVGSWAIGAALLLGRTILALVDVARLRRRADSTGRVLPGAGRRLRVVISPSVEIPAAIGYLRPAVLLPDDALRWTREERRAVLAHELAHIRRLDPWTLLLATVIRALHWPNPLVWVAHRQLRAASELACDRAAVAAGFPADRYAELLVRLVRSASGARLVLAPGIARPHGLRGRVRALLEADGGEGRAGHAGAASALVGIVALWLTVLPPEIGAAAWADRYGISESMAGLILRAAAAEGIEPALAFGLVSVESGFDPNRVSRSGAVGLAQVLPSTAAVLDPGSSDETLRDPATSLRLGLRLLGDYLGMFGGDRERALLAYHLGPVAAERSSRSLAPVAPYSAAVLRAAKASTSRQTPAPAPPQ